MCYEFLGEEFCHKATCGCSVTGSQNESERVGAMLFLVVHGLRCRRFRLNRCGTNMAGLKRHFGGRRRHLSYNCGSRVSCKILRCSDALGRQFSDLTTFFALKNHEKPGVPGSESEEEQEEASLAGVLFQLWSRDITEAAFAAFAMFLLESMVSKNMICIILYRLYVYCVNEMSCIYFLNLFNQQFAGSPPFCPSFFRTAAPVDGAPEKARSGSQPCLESISLTASVSNGRPFPKGADGLFSCFFSCL